jgi:5-methylcytosine-specific restriction endonuclease McrA
MLRGYIKKTKPATWTTVPGAVTTQSVKEGKRAAVAFLKRKFPVKRQKSVRKVSKAKARVNREYAKAAKECLKNTPKCAVCLNRKPTEVHHRAPRSVRPDLISEPSNLLGVCSGCHSFIHRNPKWAYERGFLNKSHD